MRARVTDDPTIDEATAAQVARNIELARDVFLRHAASRSVIGSGEDR